jgi:group I intron endonuclease
MGGIYKIVNKTNGKSYFGSTKDFSERKCHHFSELRGNYHGNKHLQRAYNLYGEENFEFIIVEEVDNDYLLDVEQIYLDKNIGGYNIAKYAAAPTKGLHHTDETKEKIRQAMLGTTRMVGKKRSPQSMVKFNRSCLIVSKGYSFHKQLGRWYVRIRNKSYGTYATEQEAIIKVAEVKRRLLRQNSKI